MRRSYRDSAPKCNWLVAGFALFWLAVFSYIGHRFLTMNEGDFNPYDAEAGGRNIYEPDSSPKLESFWGDDSTNIEDFINNEIDPKHRDFCRNIMLSDSVAQRDIWSQGFQEWYMYHNFFKGKVKNGVYLDVGSHKPTHLSNTAFFDICLGWHGICVEPTDTALEFKGVRSCDMARHCVWKETTNLIMIFRSDGDASMVIDEKEQNRIKREMPDRVKDLFECDAICATDLMNRYTPTSRFGTKHDISQSGSNFNTHGKIEIDLISLDVEGAEVEFLRCFPWDKYDVKMFTIEVNKGEGHIDDMMLAHGYVKYEYLSFFHSRLDAVYVKKPRPPLYPWKSETEFLQWKRFQRCDVK